ncbi:recombinase family protein [Candidatus Woesebacteria bacterium]|nr:recombinase family protein [Candidatus Woesebacteria bacterium]
MKSIIIARVSTEEQKEAGNSLPAQTHRIEQYFKRKSYSIVKRFSFDESAYKEKRDDFDSIIDFIKQQKESIAVGFDKVDRFSRDIFDKRVSYLYELAIEGKIELHFVSDGQVIDKSISAVEKFQFGINLGLAKYYSDAISDNVKRAQEQKLRKGEFPARAPFGYKNFRVSEDKTEIEVEEYQAGIIKRVFELYSTGAYSMNTIRVTLKNDYDIKWSKGYIDHVLKNSFYYGLMVWNGKSYPHKYTPIISKLLFDQVQAVKSGHNKKKFKYQSKTQSIYQGLIRCHECGCSVTPDPKKGIKYYHCTQYHGKHGARNITEEDITAQLSQLFEKIRVPDDVIENIISDLQMIHEGKIKFKDEQESKLLKDHTTYQQMRDKNYESFLRQRITDDEYDKYDQEFRDKLAEIDARLSMLQDADDQYFVSVKYILELSKRAKSLFESSKVEHKRQIINLVLSNLTLDGKELRYKAEKPFDTILNCADSQTWLPR